MGIKNTDLFLGWEFLEGRSREALLWSHKFLISVFGFLEEARIFGLPARRNAPISGSRLDENLRSQIYQCQPK